MRACATRITYPVWAELVPDLARLIDRCDGFSKLNHHLHLKMQCFSLELINSPTHFDPLLDSQGPPKNFNALAAALQQHCIPHDVEQIDLDRPWRDTRSTSSLRVSPGMSLVWAFDQHEIFPLWINQESASWHASAVAACMMSPSSDGAHEQLELVASVLRTLSTSGVAHLLIAAAKMDRVGTHLLPLVRFGVMLNSDVFEKAFKTMAGESAHSKTLRNLRTSHADWVYSAFARKAGIPLARMARRAGTP